MNDIQEFADRLKLFLPIVDMFCEYSQEEMEKWVKNMRSQIDTQTTIGVMFDMDALEKADVRTLQVDVLEKLVELIALRRKQIEQEPILKQEIGKRADIAKQLWL